MHLGTRQQVACCSSRYLHGMVPPTRSAVVISVSVSLTNRRGVEEDLHEVRDSLVGGRWWGHGGGSGVYMLVYANIAARGSKSPPQKHKYLT